MTPVQLPEVPEPFIELMTHTVYDAWAAQLRAYATEAVMAERRRVLALAEKWRALADKFAAAGGDIAIAEAASMRNDANELTALLTQPEQNSGR